MVNLGNHYVEARVAAMLSPQDAQKVTGLFLEIGDFLTITLSTGVYLLLIFGIVRPVQAYRGKMQSQVADATTDQKAQLTTLVYMPAVERHELGSQLDLGVLGSVLRELQQSPGVLEQYAAVSLNVCAASLEDPAFAGKVHDAIAASGVAGHSICFETRRWRCRACLPRPASSTS